MLPCERGPLHRRPRRDEPRRAHPHHAGNRPRRFIFRRRRHHIHLARLQVKRGRHPRAAAALAPGPVERPDLLLALWTTQFTLRGHTVLHAAHPRDRLDEEVLAPGR